MNSKNNKTALVVGVIAGTPFDTQLGLNQLSRLGLQAITGYSISQDPNSQTLLQANKSLLELHVAKAIDFLLLKHVSCIIIYCNSISSAIDIKKIKAFYKNIKFITTNNIYEKIKVSSNNIGLITANSQCAGNIEKIILKNNPNGQVIGIGLLPIVKAIESGSTAKEIIKKYDLVRLCEFLTRNDCTEIILGCTHFENFYDELEKEIKQSNIGTTLLPIHNQVISLFTEITHINPKSSKEIAHC